MVGTFPKGYGGKKQKGKKKRKLLILNAMVEDVTLLR